MPITYVGVVRDFSVFWTDRATGDLIDVDDPTMEIVHYDTYGNEVFTLDPVTMARLDLGHYVHSVYLNPEVFMVGERYFVRFRGVNPGTGDDELLEETFTAALDPTSIFGQLTASFIC